MKKNKIQKNQFLSFQSREMKKNLEKYIYIRFIILGFHLDILKSKKN